MNISIAHIHTKSGDFAYNKAHIMTRIQEVYAHSCDIVLLSAYGLSGGNFERSCLNTCYAQYTQQLHTVLLELVATLPSDIMVILYDYDIHSAVMSECYMYIVQGHIQSIPMHNDIVYFSYKACKIACILFDNTYTTNVIDVYDKDTQLIMISGMNQFIYQEELLVYKKITQMSQNHTAVIAYINRYGAYASDIYDGFGIIMQQQQCYAYIQQFVNQQAYYVANATVAITPVHLGAEAACYHALVLGVRDFVHKQGFTQAHIGLSGGIDSAFVACVACDALGAQNVSGIMMPSPYSSAHSITDAQALGDNLGMNIMHMPITRIFTEFHALISNAMPEPHGLALENIQARIRGSILMSYANTSGSLLLATGNKSELALGYCTLYGDMCGALAPIADVYKTTIYKLAQFCNQDVERIPQHILEKAPSAELRHGQKDSDFLPDYEIADAILQLHIESGLHNRDIIKQGYQAETVKHCVDLFYKAQHKRLQAPPILRISYNI